jgi:hypothetical protein
MCRKYLLAIWRNSQNKLSRPKGNSRVCRDDRCCSRAQGAFQAAGSVITQYPESLPTTPPAPACPSFTPNGEQRFTPNASQNNTPSHYHAGPLSRYWTISQHKIRWISSERRGRSGAGFPTALRITAHLLRRVPAYWRRLFELRSDQEPERLAGGCLSHWFRYRSVEYCS